MPGPGRKQACRLNRFGGEMNWGGTLLLLAGLSFGGP